MSEPEWERARRQVGALESPSAQAQLRRANAFLGQERHHEALAAYELYLALNPQSAEAWHNRAVALAHLQRYAEALPCFNKAIDLRPDVTGSWANRANARLELEQFEEAKRDYARVLERLPDYPNARGYLTLANLSCCDWAGLGAQLARISADLEAGTPAIVPFGNLMISRSPAEQMQCARLYLAARGGAAAMPFWQGEHYRHDRIRVAYLSADFRDHAVSILMAGVFEHHDKSRFETIGVSFGLDDRSEMRARIASSFERFVDVRGRTDRDIAFLLRSLEVDIAVDLVGLTFGCRNGIFALRPAPVQVNYLGYPGTTASPAMDYILADRVVIPQTERGHYSEKVVYLPDTYFASDAKRGIAARAPTRAEVSLPEKGFVFASFNTAHKFQPEMFALWMRLLCGVEGSVLWLPEGDEAARRNLQREAEASGVEGQRLVFAPFLASQDDHLARLSLADLFLDTLPCNAHTTASDALWAGVPLLTCLGTTFAGRVAASQLHAIGLPELVTESLDAYEACALTLAREPERLGEIRRKLLRHRATKALFDTARFTRNLERAFTMMHGRAQRGEPPESFAVEPATS